jgi:hypothetical protein
METQHISESPMINQDVGYAAANARDSHSTDPGIRYLIATHYSQKFNTEYDELSELKMFSGVCYPGRVEYLLHTKKLLGHHVLHAHRNRRQFKLVFLEKKSDS